VSSGSDWELGGGKRLSTNVLEVDVIGHSLGQTGVQGTNLGMNVCQKSKPCPPPNLHYQGVVDALQFQGHCSGGA
jgi:hypothetical protein